MVAPATRAKRNRAQTAEEVEMLGKPGRERTIDLERQGARRKYVKVHKSFYPVLTHRQRVERNGYVKLSRTMGRLYTMARGDGTEMTMEEFVEQLSNEELARGQIKDKNGEFRGRPPAWVPRAFHRACINELMRRGKQTWQENYVEAIEVLTEIMRGDVPGSKVRDRLVAAKEVIERIEGKIPETMKIQHDQKWMVVLDDIVAEVNDAQVAQGQKAINSAKKIPQDIIDAEIVDEEPEPDPTPVPPRPRAATRRRRRA